MSSKNKKNKIITVIVIALVAIIIGIVSSFYLSPIEPGGTQAGTGIAQNTEGGTRGGPPDEMKGF